MSKNSDKKIIEEIFEEEKEEDSIAIICPVWGDGCNHPFLCKESCRDADLKDFWIKH